MRPADASRRCFHVVLYRRHVSRRIGLHDCNPALHSVSFVLAITLVVIIHFAEDAWSQVGISYSGTLALAPPMAETITGDQEELRHLADPSHTRRSLAKERLRHRGVAAESVLREGLLSRHLEIRITAKQLLDELHAIKTENALRQFLRGDPIIDQALIPAWDKMENAAGDSLETRQLFATLLTDYSRTLHWLQMLDRDSVVREEAETIGVDAYLPLDLRRLHEGDPARWTLLLLAASQRSLRSLPILNSRIRGGLLHENVAQQLQGSASAQIIQRLVANWLRESSDCYINVSMLKIAIKYQCESTALELANQTLHNSHSSPYALATSLVILSRLRPAVASDMLPAWYDDSRVCHVWQIVASNRTVIQTQLGDVAISLALHLRDKDPRDFGFIHLEADPLLIYREFSMGFDDDESRLAAKNLAMKVLADADSSSLVK